MVDREVLDRRLQKLEQLLGRLRRLSGVERERYLGDTGLQAQAERWLHLAAETAIDIANHIIADRGWPVPESYRDCFRRLVDNGVIPEDLGRQMERWAALRNVLVHMYLEVDQETLFDILTGDISQLERFASCVLAYVEQEH